MCGSRFPVAKSDVNEKPKAVRGFAAMSKERLRELGSQGGRASHAGGKGHEWNKRTAKVAGRKGGKAKRKPLAFEIGDRVKVILETSQLCGLEGTVEIIGDGQSIVGVESTFGVVLDAPPGFDRSRVVFPASYLKLVSKGR